MDGLIRIALRTAREQSPQLIQAHDRPPISRFSSKGLQEFVQRLRIRLSIAFNESVQSHFPDHRVASGPQELTTQHGYCWFIEPLCGEENFLRSLPDYCAIIGIFNNQSLVHTVLYQYLDDQEYYATKDEGAIVNKNRLRVSSTSSLARAVIAYESNVSVATFWQYTENLHDQDLNLRCSGCVALDRARVAQGKLDASVYVGADPSIPDIASLLVSEAGGFSSSSSKGKPISIAANPQIYTELETKLLHGGHDHRQVR